MKKSEEVKSYIMKLIAEGELGNGDRLPSCRELSAKLSVNKITVNRAYREMEEAHRIYAINRGGYYLADFDLGTEKTEEAADFTAVRPDRRLLPYREFTHAINKAVDLYKTNAYDYEEPEGLNSLRQVLSNYFMKGGIYTKTENILITNGAQQAIGIALQCIFHDRKGKLLVEVPTYNLAMKQAKLMGIEMLGIERTGEGYDFRKLEELLREEDIRAFYIMPRHHNPTGFNLKESDKRRIADMLENYNIMLIEDDYLADIGGKKNAMPVHYYANKERVIYIRSFSKTFMPGLRLGAGVFPSCRIESALETKKLADLNTPKLLQAALELFIKSGMYDKHIQKVRKAYSEKMKKAAIIYQSLKSADMDWHIPSNGLFIWAVQKNELDVRRVQELLSAQGIKLKDAAEFFLNNVNESVRPAQCFRLCLSGITDKGMERLSEIIRVFKNGALK